MIHVLITGGQGQLAQALSHTQPLNSGWIVTYTSKTELNITEQKQLCAYLQYHPVDYLINCAAYTQVDAAETDHTNANAINALAPGYLANLAKELNFTLLHISTDYIFEGLIAKPLTEDMPTNPINYYGQTKLSGEQHILAKNISAYIIRTSWLYSTLGNNFLTRLLNLFLHEKYITMSYEQTSSPTYALDLAKAIWKILYKLSENPNLYQPGIYHYANEGIASRYDFVWKTSKIFRTKCEIIAQPSNKLRGLAKRPAYTVLDKQKIKQTFGLTIPCWQESLAHCLQHITMDSL